MSNAQLFFFIGKGGVGKTTCSVATALNLTRRGYRVLLVSLDPAHNIGDVLALPVTATKTTITPALDAIEIDLETLIARYLKRTEEMMKHTYRYLTVINLQDLFEAVRYSPGIEEYATLEALHDILLNESAQYDVIVFDTAPTGLTLRVLALPSISSLWVQKLSAMRQKILDLRSAVKHVHGDKRLRQPGDTTSLPSHADEDSVMQEIRRYRADTDSIQAVLTNSARTSVAAVLNAEEMPLLETQRAAETLTKFQIPLKLLVINKVFQPDHLSTELEDTFSTQQTMIAKIQEAFPQQTIVEAPWHHHEPRGIETLQQFGATTADFFANLITQPAHS